MGTAGSILAKPFRNWNIENRAHKVISQKKPKPAPTYDTTVKQIELVNKLEPDYKEKAQRRDPQLDDYLKKVYVTSNSTEVQELDSRSDPNRPLPKDKFLHEGFPYGFYEPNEVRPGRVSLRQALDFLSNHKKEPEKYTAEYIAAEHKLDKEVVENILSHYNLFSVFHTKDVGNEDVVISTIPISQRSGIQIRWTEDKEESDLERFKKIMRNPSEEPIPVEEEKKKRLT